MVLEASKQTMSFVFSMGTLCESVECIKFVHKNIETNMSKS